MKRTILGLVAGLALVGAVSVGSAATSGSPTLTIQHQVKGCHSWSLNGGKVHVSQIVRLKAGGSLTITNTDVMPHQLMKRTGGPVVIRLVNQGNLSIGTLKTPYAVGLMPHMSAVLKLVFAKAGVYTFISKAGDDYKGLAVKTTGEDNILKLKVIVA